MSVITTTATSTTSYVNAETNALAATISPTPSSAWLTAVDTLISSLKSAGVWSTFDLFYCFAAPSSNACTYNWVNTAVGLLTANGSITYSANQYAVSDGSTGWFSTSFSVNSANAVNGNAELGHFCLNDDTTDSVSVFQTTGAKSLTSLQAASTAINSITGKLNTSTSGSWSSNWGSTVGHWVLQQNSTTQLEMYLDGTSLGTSTQTNSADTGTVQIFKSSGGSYTTRKTAFAHYGSKLTAAQQLALSQSLYTFLTAMGVRPLAGYVGLSTGPTNVAPYKHVSTGNGNNLVVPITTPSGHKGLVQGSAGSYPYSLIRISDPNYLNLWRLELHSGDHAPFDGASIDRMQLAGQTTTNIDTATDLSYSFFIETGSTNGNSFWDILDQHDTTGGVNSGPTHGIDPATGKFYVWMYDGGTYTNGALQSLTRGAWHSVRTICYMDGTSGYGKSWLDGVQIYNNVGPTSALQPFNWNISSYRGGTTIGASVVWIANIELDISGTLPFAGRITSPLPVPPLT